MKNIKLLPIFVAGCLSLPLVVGCTHSSAIDSQKGFFAALCEKESEHYLLNYVEKTSRYYHYIWLSEQKCSLEIEGFIGGESQNHYRFLAFAGERYRFGIEEISGLSYISVEGSGVMTENGEHYFDFSVGQDGSWIDVAISSSSFSSKYLLTAEKLSAQSSSN